MVVAAVVLSTVLVVLGALSAARDNPQRRLSWWGTPPRRSWPSVVLPPLAVVPLILAATRLGHTHTRPLALLVLLVPHVGAATVRALHNRRVARLSRR